MNKNGDSFEFWGIFFIVCDIVFIVFIVSLSFFCFLNNLSTIHMREDLLLRNGYVAINDITSQEKQEIYYKDGNITKNIMTLCVKYECVILENE